MLEQSIERFSKGDYWPRCQCSHSHSCSWGRIQEWCLPSPSPHRSRRHVTFCTPKKETFADEELHRGCSTGRDMGERDLGLPSPMSLDLTWFIGTPAVSRSAGHRQNTLDEPSIENYKKWLEWWAWQLDTSHWWEELIVIPYVKDIWRLAQRIWAFFEVPSVRREALEGQPFTAHPAPKCIQKCEFLLDGLPCQDVRMKPCQITLAYSRALQYWAEKVNLPVSGDPALWQDV